MLKQRTQQRQRTPKVSVDDAYKLAQSFGLDLNTVPISVWRYALEVEFEHGPKFGPRFDVTHYQLIPTAQIALAHLEEFPDYYQRLYQLEREAINYWNKRVKPPIFKGKY